MLWGRQLATRQFQFVNHSSVVLYQSEGDFGIRNRGVDREFAESVLAGDAEKLDIAPFGIRCRGAAPAAKTRRFELVKGVSRRSGNAEPARAVPVTRNQQHTPNSILLNQLEDPLSSLRVPSAPLIFAV